MDSKKQRKSRTGRSVEGKQTVESPIPSFSSKTTSFSGILTTEGHPTNPEASSPLQICPPPPAPIAFHDFTSSAVSQISQFQQKPDYNISLLGVQMSFQVLNPLSSPRYSPLLPSSSPQHQYPPRFECQCSSTESAASEEHQAVSSFENPIAFLRPETTYFAVAPAISKTDSAGTQSRRVRFRPPPLTTITATSTQQDFKASDEKAEVQKEEKPVESLQVPKINETVSKPSITTMTSTTIANHVGQKVYFPSRRKNSVTKGIKADPAECQTDVTVANAITKVVPTPDNPLVNAARKINVTQRQDTSEEKSSGPKIAQERHGRLSILPSLNVLSAIRSSLRSSDDGATGSVPTNPLPNGGAIKSSTFDALITPNSPTQPPSRLTRFAHLLRNPGEPASAETEVTDASANLGLRDSNASGTGDLIPDHRLLLMEVICCCCCCCSNRYCDSSGVYSTRTNGSFSSNLRRSHRDGGGRGDIGSSGRRRGDYSNLIENHRLARLVTLLSILAILGLVLTYIIKSVIEQQQQQQQSETVPIGRNSSQ